MKRFVSVYKMTKSSLSKNAFTLIEVMVAVMIISVVIMALIQMYANNTHIFSSFKKQTKINQYSSVLISNDNYGFENKRIHLYDMVRDFDLEDDLRRELKELKVKVIYKELQTIDMSEQDSDEEIQTSSGLVLEIGKSTIQLEESSSSLIRFKIK